MATQNPTTLARRKYMIRLFAALAVYMVVLFASIYWLTHGVPDAVRIVVAVIPALPVAGIFIAGVQYLRETDEFERTTLLQSLAVAGAITAMLAVTYGFMENAGFPKLSAWWTWTVFMGSWALASIVVRRTFQ